MEQTPSKYQFTIYALHDSRDIFRTVMYVGKTKRGIRLRLRQHWVERKHGRKCAWIVRLESEGATVFAFPLEVINSDDEDAWREPERRWIRHYRDINPNLLNDSSGGSGGGEFSPESRAKNRAVNLGKKLSPEHRAKIAAWNIGKKRTPEARENMRLGQLGKKRSPEAIEKCRLASIGRKMSAEDRAKIRAKNKGHKVSLEQREAISAAHKGRVQTLEHRAKNSEGVKAAWANPEHRAKQIAASKAGWVKRKAGKPEALEWAPTIN